MTDAYMYQAALWCEDCTRGVILDNIGFQPNGSIAKADLSTPDLLADCVRDRGRDPNNESTWDTDEFPKGPYAAGGGEADTPQHCDGCKCFLENPLTGDGYEYVLAALQANDGDAETLKTWRDFYGSDRMPDDLGRSINDILDGDDESDPYGADGNPKVTGPDDWLMAGDWFLGLDPNGSINHRALYIVPLPDVVAECEGPDDDKMDLINAACRDHDRLTDADCERIGLVRVADFLKRWSNGYYTA
jgi:hypothetical protein